MFLLRKKMLSFLTAIALCIPLQAVAEYNHVTVYESTTNAGLSQGNLGSHASDASKTFYLGSDVSTPNDVNVRFSNNSISTATPVALSNSTLSLYNGTFSIAGTQGATRVFLQNSNSSGAATNTSGFYFNLTNNTVNVGNGSENIHLSGGNTLFGAFFNSSNTAMGSGSVNGNQVIFNNKSSSDISSVIGGAASTYSYNSNLSGDSTVDHNTVTISTGENYQINSTLYGGYAETLLTGTYGHSYNLTNTIDSNQTNLNNGEFYKEIIGGEAVISTDSKNTIATFTGNVQNNQINVTNGRFYNTVLMGGRASVEGSGFNTDTSNTSDLSISVHDNKIAISGGKFYDTLIIGGVATNPIDTKGISGDITGNTIEISGTPEFNDSTTLLGGYTSGSGAISNNTLSLKTKNVTVYGADNFSTYQFAVADANNGETFLTVTHGDGHDNSFFSNYEKIFTPRRSLNLENVTVQWADSTLTEQGRPANLKVGHTLTLINSTSSSNVRGTIANNGVQTDIVSGGDTYSYKVVQANNKVYLVHNGLATPGNWTQDISLTAPAFADGDVFMNIGGTLTASSVTVNGNDSAAAALHAALLDVSAQDTALTLNHTGAGQVKFDTITVGDGQSLTKTGSGFYTFDNMTINGSGSVSSLDAMSAATTVTLAGATPSFDQINLGNGSSLTVSGGTYDFNTFNVYDNSNTLTGDLNAANKNLNFYLADTTQKTDTALTVTGNADITDTTIQVGILGSDSPLRKDDSLVLLQSASLTGAPANQTGVGMQGLLLSYDFDVETTGNQLVATVTKAGLNEESKVFLEGRAATLSFVGEGGDFAASNALNSALKAAQLQDDKSLALFTAFGGGQSRYETGSHVKTNGWNAAVGLSHDVTIFSMETVLASFIEYGQGNYNSYNTFASGNLKGSGNTEYIGLGILGNWLDPEQNTYFNMSLRAGKVSSDFKSHVFFANQNASYDYDTIYYGGHLGGGYIYETTRGINVDLYARYMLTQQQGKKVTISSGDEIRFNDALSSRARAGAKATLALSDAWNTYVGAAYDYEFEGKAKASAYNMSWDAPSLQGGSVVGEVGLSYARGNWLFGLGAEGYEGERRGFSGNVQMGYKF